jgi:Mannosyltransferase putative
VNHEKFWASASPSFWSLETRKWRSYVNSLSPYPSRNFQGRGIVMIGGNGKTLDLILITLRMLRELNCKLPVEVWHLPGEITITDENVLKGLGAIPRDFGGRNVLIPMREIKGREKNFQIKVAAWVNSAFEEIIALDSDVMPVRDPTYLFDTPEYQRTGQIFWPDWWKTHRSIFLP